MEDELRRLEGLIRIGEQRNLFSHISDDLRADEKPLLQEKIKRLMDNLLSLKDSFDLRHSRKELILSSIVKSTAVYFIVELEDALSDRLKGHGPVAPALKEALDPKLREMISILTEMNARI